MREILRTLQEALERREPVALVTIVEVRGASPAKVGFKGLVWADGRFQGNVGGGALEKRIREDAQQALQEGTSRLVRYALRETGERAVGMVCGGEATAFIEVLAPLPRLLIVGGGHIGRPLAEMARLVGYQVEVVDVRADRGTQDALDPGRIDAHTYVVVVTEDHRSDLAALRQVIGTPAPYIGMIGSRRKVHTVLEALRAEGVPEERLAQVRAPIGLDLGGGTPPEIALSILAEVQQVRYGASGQPLSRRSAPARPEES
ncbi:MAG: XdhC family protein [Anaerolineae bacterium]|nr:XdhC family protein [Anaerolineae bacterium]